MKEVSDFIVKHIVSEPGDYTRYDYLVAQYGDEYIIVPYKSTFRFPIRLLYWDIKYLNDVNMCQDYIRCNDELANVNPHTLFEVVNTIKQLAANNDD